jgi:hypothetical protein
MSVASIQSINKIKKSESILQYPRHDAGNITCLSKPEG